jgi:hypothetical protein
MISHGQRSGRFGNQTGSKAGTNHVNRCTVFTIAQSRFLDRIPEIQIDAGNWASIANCHAADAHPC